MKITSSATRWLVAGLVSAAVILASIPAVTFSASAATYQPSDYTDNSYIQQKLQRIFTEYLPGASYFTNNGKACTCHNESYCCTGPYSCNCKRMYEDKVTGKTVDLLSWQCFGFARYAFYICFGFLDVKANSSLYYNAGSIAANTMTASNLKEVIQKAKTGAHIRTTQKHSMAFLSMDDNGFTVVDANSDGKCGVYVRYFTWDKFVSLYKSYGIEYIKIPLAYPGEATNDLNGRVTGDYIVTATSLNIRAGAGTDFTIVGSLAQNAQVKVLEVQNGWGRISQGWISLTYASLIKPDVLGISAKWKNTPIYYVGQALRLSDIEVTANYSNQITAPVTNGFTAACDMSTSGSKTVTVSYEGKTASLPLTVYSMTTSSPTGNPTEPPPLMGDVDDNGSVTITDARLALQSAVKKIDLPHPSHVLGDVDYDGAVTITDARMILQVAVKKLPQFPPPPSTTTTLTSNTTTVASHLP